MSSFFDRFRGRQKAEPQVQSDAQSAQSADNAEFVASATSAQSGASANSAPSATSAPGSASSPSTQSADSVNFMSPISAESPESASSADLGPQVPHRFVRNAFGTWEQELRAKAEETSDKDVPYIDLTHPHPTGGAQFASGSPTRLTSLIREEYSQKTALESLVKLREYAAKREEKYGYAPFQLAIGELTWTELPARAFVEDLESAYDNTGELQLDPEMIRQREHEALSGLGITEAAEFQAQPASDGSAENNQGDDVVPQKIEAVQEKQLSMLLRSVDLEARGEDCLIQPGNVAEVNPDVIAALRAHGTPARELGKLLAPNTVNEDELLMQVRQLAYTYLPGASYQPRTLLGCFGNPERVLAQDLELMGPVIMQSGLLAAASGDQRLRTLTSKPLPPASQEDRDPENERGVGDLDVDEIAAVEAVAGGRDVLIDAPSGSRASDVLVSIAADAAASGKNVVYIPGNKTQGKAFMQATERLGVDDIVLNLADTGGAAMRLRTGWRQEFPFIDEEHTAEVMRELKAERRDVHEYLSALHSIDPVWDTSVYEVIEKLAKISAATNGPSTKVRFDNETAMRIKENRQQVWDTLREAFDSGVFFATAHSPWLLTDISTEEEAQNAYSVVRRLASETLPLAMEQSQRVAGEVGLARATTVAQWIEQIRMLETIAATLEIFVPTIYDRSVQDMVAATASDEWRTKHGIDMKRSTRRALVKQAKDFIRPGVTVHDLHGALREVDDQRDIWRRYSAESDWPSLPDGMMMIRANANDVDKNLTILEEILTSQQKLREQPIEELLALVRTLASQREALESQPSRHQLLADLNKQGLGEFVEDVVRRDVPVVKVEAELDLAYTNSVFEQLIARNAILATASPAQILMSVTRLRQLDNEHVLNLADPVLRAVVGHMRYTARNNRQATVDTDKLLQTRGIVGVKETVGRFPQILTTSRPVWVAPSVVVAEFIPHLPWADVVIVDGIENIGMAHVVSLLARGKQIVVMGDVFRATENSALATLADVLPRITLPTRGAHHDDLALSVLRSLGFDYGKPLPAAGLKNYEGNRLILVEGQGVPSPTTGMVEATDAEVDAVVDAIIDHVMSAGHESLAVITVSQQHASRIHTAIDRARAENSALAGALEAQVNEPLAIVDITEAAGLRRDTVIFSVGFGKTVHGRVLHNFGPLSAEEGPRQFIESLMVPRYKMSVISALSAEDIGVDSLDAQAPKMIAELISAAGQSDVDMGIGEHRDEGTPLILDLETRLRKRGLHTAISYGYASGVHIPLVVGSEENKWKLAVLTDTPEYVNEPSMRKRDRHFVESLSELGWLVTYSYSTSIFLDPEGEAARIASILGSQQPASAEDLAEETPEFSADSWENFTSEESQILPEMEAKDADSENGENAPVETTPRTAKPHVQPGLPLTAYSDDQLDAMLNWIASDGVRRSETEFIEELRNELDIRRRGAQIDAVLGNVVRRSGKAHE